MGDGLGLDRWWDEPADKAAQGTFAERGAFILAKLRAHDPAKLKDVLADVYRARRHGQGACGVERLRKQGVDALREGRVGDGQRTGAPGPRVWACGRTRP
jgi:hypothetical protein